ncbi:hypothetical protein ABI59_09840 [Acidobacteria bacterium Mor1]|nr:hypothetical protein ABI59_09840 [Acidobacteria bacterium Mor1]
MSVTPIHAQSRFLGGASGLRVSCLRRVAVDPLNRGTRYIPNRMKQDKQAPSELGDTEGHSGSGSVAESLRAIVAGSERAKAWLYEQFAPRIYRRILGRYGRARWLDPDDLLQDTFVSALQRDAQVFRALLDKGGGEITAARVERMLWNIACGLTANRRRSKARLPQILHPEYELGTPDEDPESQGVDRAMLERLAQCIQRKGGRIYLYYRLRYVDGYTPEEISTLTGWSRKVTYNLKLALNRALERCSQQLKL